LLDLEAVNITSEVTYHVLTIPHCSTLVVSLSVNVLVVINVAALRQARLILGWVTICAWVNHLSTYPVT